MKELLHHDRETIVRRLCKRFDLEQSAAEGVVAKLQQAIFEGDESIFFDLKYLVHFRNDPDFSEAIVHCATETFSLLSAQEAYRPYHRQLIDFYFRFYKTIFIDRCRYAKKIEKRSDTVQRILKHMSEEMNQILDTQQLMIANISHEMRTALNAIVGYLSMIEDKHTLSGEEEGFLTKALHASSTLQALVSDILDITKINSDQLEINEETFWMDDMLAKCIDGISLELGKKHQIDFITDLDLFPFKVHGDRQHIMEILTNLLSNAIKYTDKGYICLRLTRKRIANGKIEARFQVEDTGIGMTEEQIRQIFDPFSRFKTDRKGIGLGLHITSKLAQKLGGKLKARSTFGVGSTFEFTLMLGEDPQAVDLSGKRLCFFCSRSDTLSAERKKKELLNSLGASVASYDTEEEFINYLLTAETDIPDLISVAADREGYAKFDALINYLKTLPRFKRTYFIAEMTEGVVSLRYFDKIYDYFVPLVPLIQSLENLHRDSEKEVSEAHNFQILVVDDIETNLEIFNMFVSQRYPDATIDLAGGGHEAIGMYKAKVYDIVFLDLKMPGLDGYEVLKRFESIRPLPTVYALTADVYKSTYEKVMEAGFSGLLEKPLQVDVLFETIDKEIHAKNY